MPEQTLDPAETADASNGADPDRARRGVWLLLKLLPIVFVLGEAHYFSRVLHPVSTIFDAIRAAYSFSTLAFPAIALAVGAVGLLVWRGAREDRRLRRASLAAIAAALLCFGARVYATHIEPRRLVLREVTIETPKVTRPVRLLHITDIQSPAVGAYEERVFERIRELRPDLVLHTGDLLQPLPPATPKTEGPKIAALFQTLTPPLGKFHVFGDTAGHLRGIAVDDLGGLAPLNGFGARLELDGMRFRLFGLRLQQTMGDEAARGAVETWLNEAASDEFTILFGHRPDYARWAQELPLDLCLAGHTHGGQIRLPFYGPPVTFSNVPRAWARGYREIGRTRLNVSAGIGCEHAGRLPAIRVNCPPEMTLITLRPAAQ